MKPRKISYNLQTLFLNDVEIHVDKAKLYIYYLIYV